MLGAIVEFIAQVVVEGLLVEGVGTLFRVTGALLRWPFLRGRSYLQVLREGGNGWIGLAFYAVLILFLATA